MLKTLKNKKGFTLVETMIAMAIFSIAMLGTAALYIKASQMNASGNIISSANFLAKTTLEEYKNMALSDITPIPVPTEEIGLDENGVSGTGGIYNRLVTIESIDSNNARRVTVRVTWPTSRHSTRASDAVTLTANVRGGGL